MYSSASNYIDNTGIINVTLADNPVKDTQKVSNMKLVTPIRELRTALRVKFNKQYREWSKSYDKIIPNLFNKKK